MLIGLTYDLKQEYIEKGFLPELCAEFDSPDTINAIEKSLQELGHSTIRIGSLSSLVDFLSKGKKVDLVFNICEGLNARSRESQVPALLEGYNIPCTFSDSTTLAIALDKYLAKMVMAFNKVPTAPFGLISNEIDINKFDSWKFPLFLKPVYGGTGMGISSKSLVNSFEELKEEAINLLTQFNQPVLVEEYLEGREFTVGILGSGENAKAIGTLEIQVNKSSDFGIYSYSTKQNYKTNTYYKLAEQDIAEKCNKIAVDAWKALGCKDCGRIDLKQGKDGNIYVLELNPLAGLHPIDSDLPILCGMVKMNYKELIKEIIGSAINR